MDSLRHMIKQGHRAWHRCKLEKDGGIQKVRRHQQPNCLQCGSFAHELFPFDIRKPEYSFLRLHELIYKRRNFIRFGIKSEVSCVENVNLSVRYIAAIGLRLRQVEREVILAPNHQHPRLLVIWGKYDLSFDLSNPQAYPAH